MERAINIKTFFDKISQREIFSSIKRYPYMPYNMDMAMQVVDAIGKKRNSKFKIDEENKFVYENMIKWVHGDDSIKCLNPETKDITSGRLNAGIYIAGNTGSGKSWLLEIMAAYSLIDNVQFATGNILRPLCWDNIRTDTICDEFIKTGGFQNFKSKSIIGFQDLGSEPPESMYMGNRVNVMRQVLEYRGDQTDRITLVTSNLPFNHKKFIEMYGDRVSSRLYEMCNYFELKGQDRRRL